MVNFCPSNYRMLILGDFHLNKTKHIIENLESLSFDPNTAWKCSKWATIKTARKDYLKFKKDFGIPPIVVLSVGNNDLTKVSSEHCVITSLLRLASFLHKDGVTAVVLFSLVERSSPVGPYNQQVEKINKVLLSKSQKISWLFFYNLWLQTRSLGVDSLIQGHQLVSAEHIRVSELLKNLPTEKDIAELIENTKNATAEALKAQAQSKTQPNGSKGSQKTNKRKVSAQKNALFQPESERLKKKLELLVKEKAKMTEYLKKLNNGISKMNEYIERLESVA